MKPMTTSKQVLAQNADGALKNMLDEIRKLNADPEVPDQEDRRVPRELRLWLARLRLLEAVPFSHLVADASLLPAESIRFFHLDRGWTDALVEGALSIGTVTTSERAALERLYPVIRDEVDEAERLVRMPGWEKGEEVPSGPAGTVTGFVLRSRMVSGWPGLHVRAYGKDNLARNPPTDDADPKEGSWTGLEKLGLLRVERLAPAVLFVLIDGFPRIVHIEEPRSGVQYGVDQERQPDGRLRATVKPRSVKSGERVEGVKPVLVPFRKDAPGVIQLSALAKRLADVEGTKIDGEVDAAEFGIEMLQFPYRAVFGDRQLAEPEAAAISLDAMFRPTLGFSALKERFKGSEG